MIASIRRCRPMPKETKPKRQPITDFERFKMITAFIVCLVAGYLVLHMLIITGFLCGVLPLLGMFVCLLGIKSVADESETRDNGADSRPL